ncbi:MAG: peptidase, partial [Proteobacteria bacterium]
FAKWFGRGSPAAALVSDGQGDSPAEKAGLMAGDVILSVNGEPIEQFGEVSAIVSSMRPGSEAHLGVWRDRKEIEIDVRVAELEEEPARTASQESKQKGAQLGMVVRPLSDQERRQLDSDAGVVVEQVSGPAALAGVQPGDIIVGVNGEPLESVDELREAVEQADESVALLVRRGDAQLFIPVRVG